MDSFILDSHSHGKSRVRVAKVYRSPDGHQEIYEYNVAIQVQASDTDITYNGQGVKESFLRGDNTMVVPTDTIKNHVYMVAKQCAEIKTPEDFAFCLAKQYMSTYKFFTKVIIRVVQVPWARVKIDGKDHDHGFSKSQGAGEHSAELVVERSLEPGKIDDYKYKLVSKLDDLNVLKTTQSGWDKFWQDAYTTLPGTTERLFATKVQCSWTYEALESPNTGYTGPSCSNDEKAAGTERIDFGAIYDQLMSVLLHTFYGPAHGGVYSAGVQETMYQMAQQVLAQIPQLRSVHFCLPNIHFIPCTPNSLPVFNKNGIKFENDVYFPTDEPHGLIQCTLVRKH